MPAPAPAARRSTPAKSVPPAPDGLTLSKKDLAGLAAAQVGISRKVANQLVGVVFDTIAAELAAGNTVSLVGFGVFCTTSRAKRTGRNLHTGASIEIPASILPKFRPGKALKNFVNGTIESK